jgi:hypothetical protein
MQTKLWCRLWLDLVESSLGGSQESNGWIYVVKIGSNLASVSVKIFYIYLIYKVML